MSDLIQIGIDVKTNADQASKSIERLQGSVVNNLKVVERLEKNYKLLDRALNSNKITAQKYARGVQEVDAAIEQVLNGTLQATKATNQYANATRAATGAMNQYGKVTALGGKNLNRTNMMVQQAGYQFQDFAVQIQGGTNAFVALGQQGSQLLGVFGAGGAVLGAFLAVGTAIARMKTNGKELSVDFKGLGQDLAEILSPLKPIFDGISAALSAVGDALTSLSKLAVTNLDRIATYALTAATVFAGAYVKGVIAARIATMSLVGGLVALRTALIKTGIGALVVLAGELVFQFLRVMKAVGGFGNAITALWNVSKEVLGYIADSFQGIQYSARASFQGMLVSGMEFLRGLAENFGQGLNVISNLVLGNVSGIKSAFSVLPSFIGDIARSAANLFIDGMEALANAGISAVNKVISGFNDLADFLGADAVSEYFGIDLSINTISEADLSGLKSDVSGAGVSLSEAFKEGFTSAFGQADLATPVLNSMDKIIQDAKSSQEALQGLADQYSGSFADATPELQALIQAIKDGESSVQDLSKHFSLVEKESKKAGKSGKKALEDAEKAAQAYADALDKTVVSAVGSVSDAWADFVMRGFKDFKGFVGSVLDSFKNMIAQMIAMAAKNRIMLSLGIGGVAPTGAMAGSGLLQGAGILGGGGAGIGAAMSGVGSGISGVLSGGGMASSFANLGGLASGAVGGFGAIGAAIPAVGALIAGALVLKKIFGGKKPLFSEAQFEGMADAALLTGQSFRELAADLQGVESGVVEMTRATQAVIKSIADATGGMKEFAEKSQSFFTNFYTEAEQQQYLMAKSTEQLNKQFAELNVAIPETHEEYRKLVQAQDLTTESGREMYAALLNASEAFVAVKGSAEAAARFMEVRNAQASEATLQTRATRFLEQNDAINRIDEVGTTLAQNEYLLNQFVEDYNIYVDEFNAKRESSYDPSLSKINRETLEQMTDIDDILAEGLEATSSILTATFEWYEGIKKTNDDIINMIKESIEEGTGATTADLKAFKQQGEFTQNFADVFGKYGMFEQLPYYLELIMYTKERIGEIRGFKSAAVDVMKSFGDYNEAFSVVPDAMMDLNRSLTGMAPEIKNAANLMGQIAFNFASAFDALTLGYGKISEAIGKVKTFYKEEFSTLAAEYNVEDVATQSIDISARMGAIIEAPAKLIQTIEDSKAMLDRELDKLNKVAGQLNSRMYHLTQNGIEVSDSLAASYDEISAAAAKANRAADKATEELEALKLYVSTMTQAVTDFQESVEKMLVQDIEDGVKFFEPSLLSDLSGNTKVLVANILKSITEGGYESFEEGFVRLTDMFTQNSLTVDQFNQSFGLLKDVFEGNISLTDQYTQKQASVIEKLSNAYDNLTSSLEDMLSVVSRGIGSLVGQTSSANVVATRLGSLSYLSSVASGGQAEAGSLERAVSSVTSIGATDFSTRQDFLRYVADTTQLLRSVEGTLEGQLETLEMQQVQAILGIQDTNESAATSLQSIQSLLAEFLGAGGRIPQFASGGYHSGGLRIVGENGPELEATGPSRIIPNNKISVGDDSELRREVAEMRTDLKTALVQIAKNTRKSSDTLNKFDYQGLPDSRGY